MKRALIIYCWGAVTETARTYVIHGLPWATAKALSGSPSTLRTENYAG